MKLWPSDIPVIVGAFALGMAMYIVLKLLV